MPSFKSVPFYGVNVYVFWHKMCDIRALHNMKLEIHKIYYYKIL